MQQDNYRYVTGTFKIAGFGTGFNEDLLKAMMNNEPEIILSGRMEFNKEKKALVRFEPKVLQRPESDWYYYKGHQATLIVDGKEKVTQFMDFFNRDGFNAKQSYNELNGRSVLMLNDYQGQKVPQYVGLDFANTTENGNYRKIYTNASEFDLIPLLSSVNIVGSKEEKEKILKDLNNGDLVPVIARKGESRETVHLYNIPHENSLGLINSQGVLQKIKSNVSNRIELIPDKRPAIPDTTKDLMNAIEKGPKQGRGARSTVK
jgi:hypothetical protein